VIYWVFENGLEGSSDRVLHAFRDHNEAYTFIQETNGLREWNPEARYWAREPEIEKHNPNAIIFHDKEK
jgi:hypothetical protein